MIRKSPLIHRRRVWLWVLVLSAVCIGAWVGVGALASSFEVLGPLANTEVLFAALGSIWAMAFFLHRGHVEDARFMKELLEYFNGRYDAQNNNLQKILEDAGGELDEDERLAFIDYFNLCAEEWVFRKAGYIYDPVWESWLNGMKQFASDPRVAALWEEEKTTESYYGFEFPTKSAGNK
ncbi:MAG: hypothetical protein ACF8PN_07605 [Phycisphaerales bacterium]